MQINVKEWADKLEPSDTPILNYIQKMQMDYPSYASAVIGHTKPPHPRLARLVAKTARSVDKMRMRLVRFAGYELHEDDEYAQLVASETTKGLGGPSFRLSQKALAWKKSLPVYDEEKKKAIDEERALRFPKTPMYWGLGNLMSAEQLKLEQELLGRE